MDEADALEALSDTLNNLRDNPYDISLHSESVRLAHATGMEDQIEAALDITTTFWAAGEEVWKPLITYRLRSENLETAEGVQSALKLFELAEEDYLSIPILQQHIEFLIDRHAYFSETEPRVDGLGEMFSTEWTREAISTVVARGAGHLTQSNLLWDLQRDWEMELLDKVSGNERPAILSHIESMLVERLQQPHSTHDETLQAYSTFTTNYKPPDQYEALLVQASKMRSQAVKAYERRESFENFLVQAHFSLEAYVSYIASERRAKKPDMLIVGTLYERAIAEADKRRFAGEANAEETLRSFWIGYIDLLRIHDADEDRQLATLKRATRSVPCSGEVWSRYMRFLERVSDAEEFDEQIAAVFEQVLQIGPLFSDVEQVVPVVLARGGYQKRQVESGKAGEDGFATLIGIVTDGIRRIHKASLSGDPRLRLEKYMSAICLDLADMSEHALVMWEDATKHYKTSYLAWISYTEVLIKQNMHHEARKTFKDIAMKNIDWPEAIWEAWLSFEHVYGTVEEIEECIDRIDRARTYVNTRRAREAEKASYDAMQVVGEQPAPAIAAPSQSISETQGGSSAVPIDIDNTPSGHGSKRKAEEEAVQEGSKKQKTDAKPMPLKRDRENCTVFVAGIPVGTEEEELRALFKDCGEVREVKMTPLPNDLVATVEFAERDSVPAALTKDKKRVRGDEVAVHLAWRSTLYVTNFPESADDKAMRDLFSKYGTVFDVRWPSKKFKSTRRFCYVQYTSPASAEASLELHGHELAEGLPLSVLISNPERKKDRTDSDANDREIYVAGLSRYATRDDLEKLFKTYGAVKDVRMALDKDGHSRGFGFVEFELEKDAVAALAANNYELKKRRIAVTLADTRVRAKNRNVEGDRADMRNRSLRVSNLPAGTQDGLLQQALEKLAVVKRVEVFVDKNEALVELENPSEAGKLLLHPDPIVFNGNTLTLSAAMTTTASRPVVPPAAGGLFVPRSAVSRPRAGLGSKKRSAAGGVSGGRPAASVSAAQQQAAAPSGGAQGKGQDDFRKMLGGS